MHSTSCITRTSNMTQYQDLVAAITNYYLYHHFLMVKQKTPLSLHQVTLIQSLQKQINYVRHNNNPPEIIQSSMIASKAEVLCDCLSFSCLNFLKSVDTCCEKREFIIISDRNTNHLWPNLLSHSFKTEKAKYVDVKFFSENPFHIQILKVC